MPAPANSKIAAIMIAVLIVMAPDPTDVPMALATSLAPMPQVMKTPKTIANTMKIVPNSAIMELRLRCPL